MADPTLDKLCGQLAQDANQLEAETDWPTTQLERCGRAGVFRWFVGAADGGADWSDTDIFRAYIRLSAACLTTTFVITQRTGAQRRIARSDNTEAKQRWDDDLLSGAQFATVGISHLTTSRRHLQRPVLRASQRGDDLLLDGFSPWVSGAAHADVMVIGATMDDGRQLLVAVPSDLAGVHVQPPMRLTALSASQTGRVDFDQVAVPQQWLLAGPAEQVMRQGSGANTGGLQTSALAIGLADASIGFVQEQAENRQELNAPSESLRAEWSRLMNDLTDLSDGHEVCSREDLRSRANSLALRGSQAALTAAKGTGYVTGHDAGRWCREALFFLVWSCPQPVLNANLCELAGILDD